MWLGPDHFTNPICATIPLAPSLSFRCQFCPAWGTLWAHKCVVHTVYGRSLPHAVRFYTGTYSMPVEWMHVFASCSPCRLHEDRELIHLAHCRGRTWYTVVLQCTLVNDVRGPSSTPHPNVLPPPSRHRIPSPSCKPPRQAADQMLGLNKGKTRCLVSYVKEQSRSWKAVETSSPTSVAIRSRCEAGDLNPSVYFWMRVLCLIYSDSLLDWNIIFYE